MAESAKKTVGNLNGPWAYLFKIALVVVLPWCAWLSLTLFSFSQRIAVIESNRWSAVDQAAHQASEAEAFKEIWMTINKLPSEVPPQWFLDRFNRLEAKVDGLEVKIDRIKSVNH